MQGKLGKSVGSHNVFVFKQKLCIFQIIKIDSLSLRVSVFTKNYSAAYAPMVAY